MVKITIQHNGKITEIEGEFLLFTAVSGSKTSTGVAGGIDLRNLPEVITEMVNDVVNVVTKKRVAGITRRWMLDTIAEQLADK